MSKQTISKTVEEFAHLCPRGQKLDFSQFAERIRPRSEAAASLIGSTRGAIRRGLLGQFSASWAA